MQKAKDVVTEWVHKYRTYFLCGLIVVGLSTLILGIIKSQDPSDKFRALINGKSILLEVMDTDEERRMGLSFRTGLKNNHGMMFVFDKPDKQCFWMKDMKFNIDILWFDEQKNMVHHEHDVSPSTYPHSFCANNTKYVIELNSGTMEKLNIDETAQLEL